MIALQARRAVGVSGEVFVYCILAVGNLLLLNVFVAIVALGFGEAAKDVAQQRCVGGIESGSWGGASVV